jgi:hypothetical protein
MTQVHISRQDHTVTVNHDGGDLAYVIDKAQKLWDETKPAPSAPGPAFGFQAERSYGRGGFAWDMGKGEQPEVTA